MGKATWAASCLRNVRCDGRYGKEGRASGGQFAHEAGKIARHIVDATRLHQRQSRRRVRIGHGQPRDDIALGASRRDRLVVEDGGADAEAADQPEMSAFLHGCLSSIMF
jgi:hypothetical protein